MTNKLISQFAGYFSRAAPIRGIIRQLESGEKRGIDSMKHIMSLIVVFNLISGQPLFAQTTSTASTGGTGWKRVATVQGNGGRGFGRITIYTQGGTGFIPNMIHVDWFKDWSTGAGISVHSDSKKSLFWSAVRITADESSCYIEVNFTNDIPSTSLTLISDSYGWRPATLYSGLLPEGGGTVRAIAETARMNIENQFLVGYDGNVGIGTTNPQAKLAVNGNILAKEVKVKTDISVPDYVFNPDYELTSLSEIEAYVKVHRHLPEIPSAADVEKDGLDLAEMNLLLLKKVEELTLHLIEQKKENKQLQKEMTDVRQRIKVLEEGI